MLFETRAVLITDSITLLNMEPIAVLNINPVTMLNTNSGLFFVFHSRKFRFEKNIELYSIYPSILRIILSA